MLDRIQQWLRPQTNKALLSDLLHSKQGQEELLGVGALALPNAAVILKDIGHVLSYSTSADYKVWATEVWANIIQDLDRLLNPKATQEEINFYRGALSRSLALLRISHQARLKEPAVRKQAEQYGASRPIPR